MDDDDFTPRLGRMRSRGKEARYIGLVIKAARRSGKRIGKHYAGPTWEAGDGSKAVATAKERYDGPDVNAIPWLLLNVTSAEGNGIFGKTQSVQRLKTAGGKAPADGCDQAQLGKIARVNYRAVYDFYVAGP